MSFAFESALTLAARIRARDITAESVVGATLKRIAAHDALNAFITVCADDALAAARDIDARLDRGEAAGPLAGVPVSVKDIINTAGLRTTWGSRLMADNVPEADAVAVKRLKQSGAVIVGKTTTSEFAHKLMTDAPLFGTTRNPWNSDFSPGGSSGGSAAAVAAGLGPLSLATDAGASTRLPAACTGIVGLKPTLGLVPHSQVPDGFNNFIHLGLMARTVADVAAMLDVVAGPDASDPHSIAVPAPQAMARLDRPRALAGVRIGWLPLAGNKRLSHEVREACERILDRLKQFGCVVESLDAKVESPEPAWRILQQSNWAARFFNQIDAVADRIDPSFADGIRAGGAYTGQQLLQATYRRTQFFRQVQTWFARYDFVVTPTASRPPLRADHQAFDPIAIDGEVVGDMRAEWVTYLSLFDLTGHPAISIPAGLTSDGLPLGMQIVGPWYGDANVLQLAAALEQDIGWTDWRPAQAA